MRESEMTVRMLSDDNKIHRQWNASCHSCGDKTLPLFVINVDPNHKDTTHEIAVQSFTLCPKCLGTLFNTVQALLMADEADLEVDGECPTLTSKEAIRQAVVKEVFGQTCDRCNTPLTGDSLSLRGMLLCPECGRVELNNWHERNTPPPKLLNLPTIKKKKVG
jgi:predicted RNA-binding Zn-ribbon protein involved in translation (DUF1610 family)